MQNTVGSPWQMRRFEQLSISPFGFRSTTSISLLQTPLCSGRLLSNERTNHHNDTHHAATAATIDCQPSVAGVEAAEAHCSHNRTPAPHPSVHSGDAREHAAEPHRCVAGQSVGEHYRSERVWSAGVHIRPNCGRHRGGERRLALAGCYFPARP